MTIEEHVALGGPPWRLRANQAYEALQDIDVSVVITLYNYAGYIEECFESLVASIQFDVSISVEVVIIDDASTDDGALVLLASSLAHRQIPLLLVKSRHNGGLSHARNLGLRLSRGSAAFILDADNTVKPPCISRLYRCLRETGANAAYGQIEKISALDGSIVGLVSNQRFDLARLLAGNYIDAMAMFSIAALFEAGLYDVGMIHGWEDYDIWLAFAFAGMRVEYVEEVLACYRVHADSMLNRLNEHVPKVGRYLYLKYQQLLPQPAADSLLFGVPVALLFQSEACVPSPDPGPLPDVGTEP